MAPSTKPERHGHPALTEAFSVRSGTVSVRLGRDTSVLRVGDRCDVPPGTVHAVWNPGDGPAEIDVDIIFEGSEPRPRADLIRFGASYDELVKGGRRLGILPMAVLMDDYAEAFALPMPLALQRMVIRPLAALGRARGHGSGAGRD